MNPIEMAMGSEDAVVRVLSADPDYVSRFSEAFGVARNPITFARVTEAIGAYERTLVTPGRWDAYLGGDSEALSEEELSGLKTFLSLGCMSCHTGALLGGSSFERLGLVEPWPNQADPGRLAITKDEADRMSFKVPSLRNVARTAPYFHDGSAPTLEDAIRLMAKHQTGVVLAPEEVDAVAAFLRVLDGDLPEVTQAPTSPGPPTPLVAPSSSAAALAPKAPDVLGLMRGTLSPALDAGDFAKLAAGFRRVKALAPAGYPGWAGYAEAGLAAAASGDFVEARAACAGCHNQYKDAVRKLRTGR